MQDRPLSHSRHSPLTTPSQDSAPYPAPTPTPTPVPAPAEESTPVRSRPRPLPHPSPQPPSSSQFPNQSQFHIVAGMKVPSPTPDICASPPPGYAKVLKEDLKGRKAEQIQIKGGLLSLSRNLKSLPTVQSIYLRRILPIIL